MKWKWPIIIVFLAAIMVSSYMYMSSAASDDKYEFLGRLGFVKISNPDIFEESSFKTRCPVC